jgi:phosphatidylserine/phosphatidylglycerophosphate/cardiolipin synthase-like enzyme
MRMRSVLVAVVLSLAPSAGLVLAGCGENSPAGVDASVVADALPDAPGVGCTATSPREVTPEAFVGPEGLQARMTALIDGAQQSIDVHMYLFTVRALAERLVDARARGVSVRVIIDPDTGGDQQVRSTLASGGVPVRDANSLYEFAHAKYLVIDGKAAVIMSANFNGGAMSEERNYGIVDRDPDDVADLQAIFAADWAAAGGESAQPADLSCTRLVVSPNNAKQRILALIESARTTLELEIMYLAETNARDAIVAAKQRGVDVRVILGDRQDGSLPMLRAAGIPVRFPRSSMHAKLIIADGVAFVGSQNLSNTALTRNREVGALVFEPAPAQVIRSQFETDWAGAATN